MNDNPFDVGTPEDHDPGRWFGLATWTMILFGFAWIVGSVAYRFWMSGFLKVM